MTLRKKIIFSMSLLSSLMITNAHALPQDHYVILTECLNKHVIAQPVLAKANNLLLIKTNEAGIESLIQAKLQYSKTCGGFMDITADWNTSLKTKSDQEKAAEFLKTQPQPFSKKQTNYHIQYATEVAQLKAMMSPERQWNYLTKLTNYPNRYANSDHGLQVANDIKHEIEQLALANGRNDVSVYFVETKNYKQPSVVAKIGKSNAPGVVIGGHMDTLSGVMPGADDDGTGSSTILELANILLSSGMHFEKPIYLIWYSAEELGLIGSRHVVADFIKKKIPVSEVIQFDMTGYSYKNDPTMWLIDDYVNTDLTMFLETLIKTYVKKPVKHTKCNYACSDHASWNKEGFASSMPFESSFNTDNPYIHSSRDTMDKLSLSHMTSYTTLGLAFAVELAHPVY